MDVAGYLERYQQIASLDQSKNGLIEELLQRVTNLEEAYSQEKLDHERETRFNRDIQIHEMELMDKMSRIKTIMDREPFVVVLLDGDGMIFNDELLQQGEQGGRSAAVQLSTALQDYVDSNFPGIASPKIITKIYTNVKGLSDMCVRGGVLNEQSLLDDFVRGFNESIPLFDMVDVGVGKDGPYHKIGGMFDFYIDFMVLREPLLCDHFSFDQVNKAREATISLPTATVVQVLTDWSFLDTFNLYLYNCHCHQIFLGCSPDSGYSVILEDILADRDLIGRVSLVEGIPFEKDLELLKSSYRVTKFSDIFRTAKITPVMAPWKAAVTTKPRSLLTPSPVQHTVPLSRAPTNITLANNGTHTNASAPTPSLGNTPSSGEFQVVHSKASNSARPKTVERNRYGQRVDRLDFKTIPRDDLNRIKKLKLCNFYYLLGECPNDSCHHDHSRKLSKNDYFTLSAIARMTPCRFGLECDDPECMYGHRCPQSEPGKKECYWGSSCRFDTAAHGIDTNIVKLTKV